MSLVREQFNSISSVFLRINSKLFLAIVTDQVSV